MAFRKLQSSFNGGALARRLQSRSDVSIYEIGAAAVTNMIATVEGALIKRSGTLYRAAALSSASWLSTFIFNATQSYVIEWSDQKLRFITNNSLLEDGGGPVEVAVPYTAAQAARVSTQQNFDVVYMAHDEHPPAELRRTAANAFSHVETNLIGGPFGDRNGNEAIKITATGTLTKGGTVTLAAAGGNVFTSGHVGGRMRIEAEDFAAITAWEVGIDGITVGAKRRSEGKVYEAVAISTDGRTGTVQPTHTRGSEWDGDGNGTDINEKGPYGVKWQYLYDRFGVVKITNVASATSATATVERALPDSLASVASHRWTHGLFSQAAGYPHLVVLWYGRLWYFTDFDLAGSVSGSYRDFSEYNEAGEVTPGQAIRRRMDIPDKPLWARVDRSGLVIGTSQGEYAIRKINNNEQLSADNLEIVPQSAHGSNEVWPQKTASQIIFAQRGGRKVRAQGYDFSRDRYIATNLTLWARQIATGIIKQFAYQAEPEELLWLLREDGIAAAHPYNPDQDVKGWTEALNIEGADILSAVSIPSPDGGRDDLWLLVDRDGVKSHEQLEDWWDEDLNRDPKEAYFMDSGLKYSGAPATVFAGLDHLVGKTLMVLADGARHVDVEVAGDGSITLQKPASKVSAGLPYTALFTSLRPEIPRREGTSQALRKRIVAFFASLIDSFDVRAGDRGGILDRLLHRSASTPMGDGPELFTGWTDNTAIGGGHNREGQSDLVDRSPFPWILTATVTELDQGEE